MKKTKGLLFLLILSYIFISEVQNYDGKELNNKKRIIVSSNYLKHTTSNNYNSLNSEQKLEDLEMLHKTLKKEQDHFNESLFLEKQTYIKENINKLDDLEFNYELKKLLAYTNDSHTFIFDSELSQPIIPIWKIKEINGRWYIEGIIKEYNKALGNEIVSINGYSMNTILKKASPYISYENEFVLKTRFAEAVKYAEFLKYIGIIENTDKIEVGLINQEGKSLKLDINTVQSDDENAFSNGSWLPYPETGQNKKYRIIDLEDDVLFIQCNQCNEDKDYPIKDFESDIANKIKTGNYNKVIFDLRYNTGGNYPDFYNLTNITGNLKDKYNYDLYVLIGQNTFSAGVMQAVQLKESGAVLVGSPTGGAVNFYANTNNFELPNSNIKVMYSTGYVEMIPGYKENSLYPDINIKYDINDYINGIDTDINEILSMV